VAEVLSIPYSKLEERLDAEYYRPEYLEIERTLDRCSLKKKTIGQLEETMINGVEIRNYVPSGIPYLRVSDMEEVFAKLDDVKFIRENAEPSKNVELLDGDLLINRSGTLGVSVVVDEQLKGSVISSHLIRLRLKELNPYYLVAFLNCKYGRSQILRRNNGTVVPEINHQSLRQVRIPVCTEEFQRKIEDLLTRASKLRKEGNIIYKNVEQDLYERIGIDLSALAFEVSFETRFSELENRLDAEYYQPKYTYLLSHLTRLETVRTLDEISKGVVSGSYLPDYVLKGTVYLRVQNIQKTEIDLTDVVFVDVIRSEIPDKIRIKERDVILTRTGTTGVASVAPKDIEGAVMSQHLTRISLKEGYDPYYVALCLNSAIGQLQAERPLAGSMQKELIHSAMKRIRLPILLPATQKEMAVAVKKCIEMNQESKSLIQAAKREVEHLIRSSV